MNEPTTTQETPTEEISSVMADVFAEEPTSAPAPVEVETQEATPAAPEPKEEPLTAQAIAQAVKEGMTAPQQEKEYTKEELDKMFKVWQPDDNLIQQIAAGGPEAIAAFVAMRDGLAAQFSQMTTYQLEVLKKELSEQYSPALTYAQEARAERERKTFFDEHSDLTDHPKIVDIAYKSLIGEGTKFKTSKEARTALADRARQLIPTNNGNGTGITPTSGARNQTNNAPKPRPASLSTGGGVGGGGGTSAPPNVFHEIFGTR